MPAASFRAGGTALVHALDRNQAKGFVRVMNAAASRGFTTMLDVSEV
jgi:hypothetical protein